MKKIFLILFFILFLSYVIPPPAFAQACTSATIDKTSVKQNESVTITANSDTPADNFFFGVRNLDNPDGAGGFKPACVSSGGDTITASAACPAGTYPLIFKDPNTALRTTGTRTLTETELFQNDINMFPPYGTRLVNIQIVAYVQNGSGPLSPVNPSCTLQTSFYRPTVCSSSSISGSILTSTSPLQITLNGTPPASTSIVGFTLAFYNLDNLFSPGNPRPIFFNGQQYTVTAFTAGSTNTNTFTVNFNDLYRPDENWGNQIPTRIQASGYFSLTDTGFSAPDANCVTTFTLQSTNITPGGPTPTPPPGGPVPTFPPPGWFAPDGSLCNNTNYHSFFSGTDCTGNAGYTTENITPQSQCSLDGSGRCFKTAGQLFSGQAASYWKFDSQACVPITSPYTPPNAYDTIYQCRWGIPPVSSINGSVTAYFVSPQQFDRIYIWLTDTLTNYARFFEIDKAQIVSGQGQSYFFNNLFPDRKYDTYVKAYGPGGIYLDHIIYDSNCGQAGCRTYPNQRLDFTLTFPNPPPGYTHNQVTNELFRQQIEKWINGQISALEMSLFIRQLSRVPGLQKATCDPRIPGGCVFP